MEPNVNLCPSITHQPSILGGAEFTKLLFDDVAVDLSQARKTAARHADAWETLRYTAATSLQAYTHAINMGSVLAGQAGVTEQQQTVSPVRTASADNLAAGSTPANRITDTSGAVAGAGINSATAQSVEGNVTEQIAALTAMVASLTKGLAQIVAAQAQG